MPDDADVAQGDVKKGRPLWLMALMFVLVVAVLQWAWSEARGTAIERAVIDTATVGTAAVAINALTPDVHASAAGARIRAPHGGINVLNGCEGTEVLFLFVAALMAYPMSWRTRIGGLVVGTVFVFVANQVRLIALFYAYQNDRGLFDQLHGMVMPLALIVATLGLFVWLIHLEERFQARSVKARQA